MIESKVFLNLKKVIPGIQKEVLMKDHTTFKIGGPAKYFLVARSKKDILRAIKEAKKLKVQVFILGGGSNLLVSEKGFNGLVIKVKSEEPITLNKGSVVESPAGVILGDVVKFSINNSLQGLEWAGGLPGTFGGAVRGNAGAFGGEIKDAILKVEALDNSLKLRKLSNKQCGFSYRNSIFKRKNWIILSASLKLKNGNKKDLQDIANSRISYRKEKHPLEYPNAGSIFKNVGFKELSPKVKKLFIDKVKKDPFPIVPSAWFIIGAGLTGKKVGGAQISDKHSNYIINTGQAKADDVLMLIELVKKEVKKKYGVMLEQEIQFLQ